MIFPFSFMKKQKELTGKKPEEPAATDAATAVRRSPIKIIRVEDCSASIWAREYTVKGKPTTFYSMTLERSYKDRQGTWQYTKSFDPQSLGKIVSLCQQASEAIESLQQEAA